MKTNHCHLNIEMIAEALKCLLKSCDEITIEAHLTKVKITKQIGYNVGVMKKGRYDYEYQFIDSLFELAEKIESGDF